MAKHSVEEMQKHVRSYILVFLALMVLTVVTVAVSFLEFEGRLAVAIGVTVALIIAVIKSSLVISIFMHLISEKKLIFLVLGLTVIFFAGMVSLTIFSDMDPITDGNTLPNFEAPTAKEAPHNVH
jgi:cytochrome c oxidase subunit 4